MKLSDKQIEDLDRQGHLILPDRFSDDEITVLKSRLPRLLAEHHPANIIEQSSNVVRTAMGLHTRDDVFAKLVRHPRLIEPAQQVRSGPLYVQQVKVNMKAAFSGETWQWHYDFATHRDEDGIKRPLAINLHIFLDDITEFNGPLYFIPGSHKYGEHQATLDDVSTSYPLWVVKDDLVKKLAEQHGLVSATGKKGTMLIFFDTLLHGSPNNISPWDRSIFSLIVNPVSNASQNANRPDYKHHQDTTPIELLADDCLLESGLF